MHPSHCGHSKKDLTIPCFIVNVKKEWKKENFSYYCTAVRSVTRLCTVYYPFQPYSCPLSKNKSGLI